MIIDGMFDALSDCVEKGPVRKRPRFKIKRMWAALADAARRRRKCYIRYRKRGEGTKYYLVAPYSFRTKPGGNVLFAYDFVDGHIKSFFRARVSGVHVTDRRFVPKWDVEIAAEEKAVGMFGILKPFEDLSTIVTKEKDYLSTMDDFMAEGLSPKRGVTIDDVDPEQLRMGIAVEMEHTEDRRIAEKIALDHLAEFEDYYTALAEMERKLKEKKKGAKVDTEKGKSSVGAPPNPKSAQGGAKNTRA